MVLRMQNQFVVHSSNIQENAMKTNEYKHFKVKKTKEALSLILASISSIQQPYFQSVHPQHLPAKNQRSQLLDVIISHLILH